MGVPGPVTSGLSAGVHAMLREEGSLVVTDAAEVIELVGSIGELAPRQRGPTVPRDALPVEATTVLDALPPHGTAAVGPLARETGLSAEAVLVRLQELCALGFVERRGGEWQLSRAAIRDTGGGHTIE